MSENKLSRSYTWNVCTHRKSNRQSPAASAGYRLLPLMSTRIQCSSGQCTRQKHCLPKVSTATSLCSNTLCTATHNLVQQRVNTGTSGGNLGPAQSFAHNALEHTSKQEPALRRSAWDKVEDRKIFGQGEHQVASGAALVSPLRYAWNQK